MANLVPLHIDKDTGEIVARGSSVGGGGGSGQGYLFEQVVASTVWTIPHGLASDQVLVQVYDEVGEFTIPDEIEITDITTVTIRFTSAMAGTAHLIFFTTS